MATVVSVVPVVQAVEVVQAVVVALGSTGEVHWPCSWRLFAAYCAHGYGVATRSRRGQQIGDSTCCPAVSQIEMRALSPLATHYSYRVMMSSLDTSVGVGIGSSGVLNPALSQTMLAQDGAA